MATGKFKPCEDCSSPAACKKAGKCGMKTNGKNKGKGAVMMSVIIGIPVKKKAKK